MSYIKGPASVALVVFAREGVELSAFNGQRELVEHLVDQVRLYGPEHDDAELASWLERVSALSAHAALVLRNEIVREQLEDPTRAAASAAQLAFDALEDEANGLGCVVSLSDDGHVELLATGDDVCQDHSAATLAEILPSRGGWPVDVVLRAPGGSTVTRRAASVADVPRAEFAALLRSLLLGGGAC